MLRRDNDVLHARVLCDSYPLAGVKLNRLELRSELLVLGARNVGPFHDPFADSLRALSFIFSGGDRIKAPMDEHSESRFSPPLHASITFRLCLVVCVSVCLRTVYCSDGGEGNE